MRSHATRKFPARVFDHTAVASFPLHHVLPHFMLVVQSSSRQRRQAQRGDRCSARRARCRGGCRGVALTKWFVTIPDLFRNCYTNRYLAMPVR